MKNRELHNKAKKLIPGVTQLLSKRPEMFAPNLWPAYYSKAKGAEIWDLEGTKYIDMSIAGIGANVLGYADDDVNNAVIECIKQGNSSSLNPPEEVELAEILCEIHPWADMVRYARTGGESMAVAVRIARAYIKKDKIAFCGYHGWHDWYLATNLENSDCLTTHLLPGLDPLGVPKGLKGTALPFKYNDIDALKKIIKENKDELGSIIMEPLRNSEPLNNFLQKVRDIADENNLVLVFDEISAGFRLTLGGAHLDYGVNPDIAVFAKAISNGFPMAAIIGREKIMQAAQSTFISSTYWTEAIGPVAAIATISKFKEKEVWKHLHSIGDEIQKGWTASADKHGLNISVGGMYPLSHFAFENSMKQEMATLFVQLMLERGFLASTRFYAMYAHTDSHVKEYLGAVDESFSIISKAETEGTIKKMLKSDVAHSGFQRLN